jgi:hypothetical protein
MAVYQSPEQADAALPRSKIIYDDFENGRYSAIKMKNGTVKELERGNWLHQVPLFYATLADWIETLPNPWPSFLVIDPPL